MSTKERELNDKIEEIAIKALRREQILKQRIEVLEGQSIKQESQSKFQDTMIGALLIVIIIATIIF